MRGLLTGCLLAGLCAAANGAPIGEWRFRWEMADDATTTSYMRPDLEDSAWETTTVPHVWPERVDGAAWYRTTLRLSPAERKAAAESKAVLVFRQVDDAAFVHVDGKLVKENYAWNRPFFVDLAPILAGKAGDAPLSVAVRVVDHGHGGGILQPVELIDIKDRTSLYRSEWSDRTPLSGLDKMGPLVMYSVYIRNFSTSGTFEGLRERLPDLAGLGVNILWLLPIHDIGVEKRKGVDGSPYAIRDYYSVHPDMGTKEDFRRLVADAHKHGMKVIIDSVMNHMSPDSVVARERPELFVKGPDGKPAPDNPDWSDVVDWDWENPEVWEYCLNHHEYWVREFDIDGYRCDVADLMPGDFWLKVRARLDRIKPGGIFMLAESRQPQKHLEGFDLTYGEDLWDAIGSVTAGRQSVDAIREALLLGEHGYPRGATQIQFVENHDKERAMNQFGGAAQARLAGVMTATLPGVPMLYTGTEVGAEADRDATFFVRSPVDFTKDPHGMRGFWTSLLALRAKHPALQVGGMEILESKPPESSLVYMREHKGDRVLVAANFSATTGTVTTKAGLLPGNEVTLGPWGWTVIALPGSSAE